MMQTIQLRDRKFRISIPESEIGAQVKRVSMAINRDYQGKEPVFLVVLNGAFMFASDLLKEIELPCQISFVKLASYQGMSTTGRVRELLGLSTDITGRPVIVLEDVVDTGLTMAGLLQTLEQYHPESVEICTLLLKPESLRVKLDVRYWCLTIPNDFIVGYGLDYDGYGRNLRDIYTLVE